MDDAHERHNKLAHDFILQMGKGCHTAIELMVVLESILMGGMVILNKQYHIPPAKASEAVEEAVVQAIVRFSKKVAQEPK